MTGDRVVFGIKGLPGYAEQKSVQAINSSVRALAEKTMIDTASITTVAYKQHITMKIIRLPKMGSKSIDFYRVRPYF